MIDYFALGLTHLLIAIAAIRLLSRGDLDRVEDAEATGLETSRPPRRERPR
ncbi:hypothetical protein G7A66_12335 [Altererythrobacter sp. SALINAS58]|uniref:hypothetical protein n=1 Tax=Alteripontixanthobacter muriae TaxID=2705546 RepID=UPI00157779EC|nr:hypothetical protein [Alteripontixanthobacter muriae]NTZ43857.1 hypothetical protein [Alteripontixanthobacter muriae]